MSRILNKKMSLIPLVTMTVSGIALALWLGGFQMTGQLTATEGTQPTAVECSRDFNITNDQNVTEECEYINTDDTVNMLFSCNDSGISSVSDGCNYESNKDIKFYVGIDNSGYEPCLNNPTKTITQGTHNISVLIEPDPHRCALNGTYSVSGSIV